MKTVLNPTLLWGITIVSFVSIFLLVAGLNGIVHATEMRKVLHDLRSPSDWQAAHDVSPLTQTSEGIQFECTDADPYIHSRALRIAADQYAALLIDVKVSAGSQLQVFWTRDDDPRFSEGKSIRVPLTADDTFHTYPLMVANHTEWKGIITRLRLDPSNTRAQVTLRSFQVADHVGPMIKPVFFHPRKPFYKPGEAIQLQARFRNEGDAQGTVGVSLTGSAEIEKAAHKQSLILPPFEEREASWTFTLETESSIPVVCDYDGERVPDISKSPFPLQTVITLGNPEPRSASTLEGREYCLQFQHAKMGWGMAFVSHKKNKALSPLAVIPYLSLIKIQHRDDSIGLYPIYGDSISSAPNQPDQQRVSFSKIFQDRDKRTWTFKGTVKTIPNTPDSFRFNYTLESDGGRLLHFSGPELYIGERSFGGNKDAAVFPGIEYLDREAVSSSDAVARPPVRDQFVPHPYKNTIPYMSLTYQGNLISVLWPAHAAWAPGQFDYSPTFAVPNRFYGQDNHLFRVFIPPVPEYTLENRETAFQFYVMKKDQPVHVECVVHLESSPDPNNALDSWLRIYGDNQLPDPIQPPRSYAEEIQLSRQAYLHSCWHEEAKGWGHCVGWDPLQSGGMLALMDVDAFLQPGGDDQEAVKQRVELVKNHILDTTGPNGLGSPAGCHVMTFEPAFYWGVTQGLLPQWRKRAMGMKQSQNADGSWGFHPTTKERQTLGKEGQVVSGTISPHAMYLMRLARITGDPIATETGLQALQALNRRTVPRGAQGWECPIMGADILVSAHGTRANLDAYRITGDSQYLEHAVYWAKSGIVFHYLWNLEDRPLQRYATIPIFGTTFYHHSWLGVPVQWCGLVYAYALQELAPYDSRYPWLTVARGIVNSAMIQQMTDGPYIGTLPDSYGEYFITARGAWINPENIMTNVHALHGNSLNIQTVFPDDQGKKALRISANAAIENAQSSRKRLAFAIKSKPARLVEILIAPLSKKPAHVSLGNGQPLSYTDRLYGTEQSWTYVGEHDALLIHIKQEKERFPVVVDY